MRKPNSPTLKLIITLALVSSALLFSISIPTAQAASYTWSSGLSDDYGGHTEIVRAIEFFVDVTNAGFEPSGIDAVTGEVEEHVNSGITNGCTLSSYYVDYESAAFNSSDATAVEFQVKVYWDGCEAEKPDYEYTTKQTVTTMGGGELDIEVGQLSGMGGNRFQFTKAAYKACEVQAKAEIEYSSEDWNSTEPNTGPNAQWKWIGEPMAESLQLLINDGMCEVRPSQSALDDTASDEDYGVVEDDELTDGTDTTQDGQDDWNVLEQLDQDLTADEYDADHDDLSPEAGSFIIDSVLFLSGGATFVFGAVLAFATYMISKKLLWGALMFIPFMGTSFILGAILLLRLIL